MSISLKSALPLVTALILAAPAALADPQGVLTMVELPVEAVYAPSAGYDDNDNIQIVLRGTLPNGCYVLADAAGEPVMGTRTIRLRQRAFKKLTGVCEDETTLPDAMKFPLRFTSETSVGILDQGEYSLSWTLPSGLDATRKLGVAKAATPATDSLPYAAVTQIAVKDIVASFQPVTFTISGVLNSSCMEIDNVQVVKNDDVFVVLPILKRREGVICTQLTIPFFRKVNLGKQAPGEYLIHVRSMNGRAVNHIVEVYKK
jgi:hypothetical protein